MHVGKPILEWEGKFQTICLWGYFKYKGPNSFKFTQPSWKFYPEHSEIKTGIYFARLNNRSLNLSKIIRILN